MRRGHPFVVGVAAAIAVLASFGGVGAAELQEGRDYTLVMPAQPTPDATKIVVLDFFSYACPHCFVFAPALKSWESKKAADVVVERVAVSVGRQPWVAPAQLFYTLRSLGKDRDLDGAVFDALHVEHVDLTNSAAAISWAAAHGLDRTVFAATFDSFSVRSFVARGDQLAGAVQLRGVPSMVVDGQYMVAIDSGGDLQAQLAVVDALIAKARAERLPAP
jgi:protein dithiol oxidoreductase (disulfide-forming)